MTKILLVEDEEAIRKFVTINLQIEGYDVMDAESGEKGLELADSFRPHIVLLDVMLPGIDGFEVCSQLRQKYSDIGIIMLTAKSQDVDRINGLESGSDDYVTKPFNPKELILRIKSLERRLGVTTTVVDENNLISGPFQLHKNSRKITKNGEELELTPTEYSVLKLFIESPNIAFTRDEILDSVWGEDFIGDSKIVDVNIRRLRSKVEDEPSRPKYIKTLWGVGYSWET